MESIPVVDLRDHTAGGASRAAFVRTLGSALEQWGFVAVVGHGVPDALLARAYAVAAEVFAQSLIGRRTASALAESEARNRSVVEAAADGRLWACCGRP